jgi:hypothetical protein
VGTLYVALAALWSLPNPEAVAGTVLAVDTFLGTLLHLQSASFKANQLGGQMVVMPTPDGKKTYSLELNGDPEKFENQDQVTFDVVKSDTVAENEQMWMKRS